MVRRDSRILERTFEKIFLCDTLGLVFHFELHSFSFLIRGIYPVEGLFAGTDQIWAGISNC